ncbi:MAG: zinc ribbon domain-containing protein [Methanospirillum sp.]
MNETSRSCGMPLAAPDVRGTESDGTQSAYYCR